MKQNETTSSAVQGMDVERQEMRKDFCKRIRRLMNDANVLQGRMVELINDLDEDEDAGLQEALHEIDYAVDGINECIHHVDWAYDVTKGVLD